MKSITEPRGHSKSVFLARLMTLALIIFLSVPVNGGSAFAQVKPAITYNPQTNTIEVRKPGSVVRLTDINNALRNNALLESLSPGEWLLKVRLTTYEQVRLELHGRSAGGDVDWLKLRSEPSGYALVESSNGQISIRDTRITSWDTRNRTFDTAFEDGSGRAYISAKNRTSTYTDNRMDVINSEVAYLGFFEETAYGISWKVLAEPGQPKPGIIGKGMTGAITNSKFHHNYFGVYVWGVGDMVVRDNEFYENFRYGFDAHTSSQRVTVENNIARDNGTHGIIFAERCTDNIIRGNKATNNKGHGIMLHESSDRNVIENNTIIGNDDGVALFESSNNRIARNVIRDNRVGLRVYGRAVDSASNLFEDNEISGSQSYGVFMYNAVSQNTFRSNRILSNRDAGVYANSVFDNIFTGNVIRDNEYGIRFDSADIEKLSKGNQVRDNVIENSRQYGVFSYASPKANVVEGNQFSGNTLGDINYPRGPVPGESGSRIFQWLRLAFVGIIVIAGIIAALAFYARRRPPA